MTEGKIPPQAIELEEAVLGALLLEKEAIADVANLLQPKHFYLSSHNIIYSAIVDMMNNNEPIDLLTVTNKIRSRGLLKDSGGAFYITELTSKVSSAANIDYHSRIIVEKSIRRELIATCSDTIKRAYDETEDVFDTKEKHEKNLFDIDNFSSSQDFYVKDILGDVVEEIKSASKNTDGITGINTGYPALNKVTAGWQKTDLVIVAARPAQGKCLAPGTKVMMYHGGFKKVENIKVGDLLMGPDGNPKTVLGTNKGTDRMYWVRQSNGIDYKVNSEHILSLKHKSTEVLVNIPVYAFVGLDNNHRRTWKGWKGVSDDLSDIDVKYDGVGEYYGFKIDGDGLFMLEDSTVTHNSDLALNLARNAANEDEKVALFSLEMSNNQLVKRLIAIDREIDREKIKLGTLSEDDWENLTMFSPKVNKNIIMNGDPNLTVFGIKAKARRLVMIDKIKLIIIDYLQLINSINTGNSNEKISEISRHLKLMAKELNIPVIALSQLSRAVESRGGDKRPMLSDLRDSGAIEQDADIVIFPFRPVYYGITKDESGEDISQLMEIIFAKNRSGRVGTEKLRYLGKFGKTVPWSRDEEVIEPQKDEARYGQNFRSSGEQDFDNPQEEGDLPPF